MTTAAPPKCRLCGGPKDERTFEVKDGNVKTMVTLALCPTCDRPECPSCKRRVGKLLERGRPTCACGRQMPRLGEAA